ncbi:hypothetical protein PH5382_02988 [Phaeobacter sp. CECT 5382]|nr:hypothetical protein PH5382_02988 [Phaeobacter sp. CECT 5382]
MTALLKTRNLVFPAAVKSMAEPQSTDISTCTNLFEGGGTQSFSSGPIPACEGRSGLGEGTHLFSSG